jgi:hypothetical protein
MNAAFMPFDPRAGLPGGGPPGTAGSHASHKGTTHRHRSLARAAGRDMLMLMTPYLYRLHGYQHPLLHLKRLGPAGIFESYAQQFEAIWAEAQPVLVPGGGAREQAL